MVVCEGKPLKSVRDSMELRDSLESCEICHVGNGPQARPSASLASPCLWWYIGYAWGAAHSNPMARRPMVVSFAD